MHFCWEIIAHAHLMRDQIPCIPVGRPCPEKKFSGRLFPVQFSQRAISGAHLKICWEHHVQCAFAACNFCHCLPSQLGCRCAGTVRGVWLHGSQHVRTVHLRGGCAGQHVHWEGHSPRQGRSSAGPRAHPRQESGNANDDTEKFLQRPTKMLVEISSSMLPTIMTESCAPPYPLLTILQEVSKGL